MLGQIRNSGDATAIQQTIPNPRFQRYTSATGGAVLPAARLYVLDAELRGALLELIHFTEIGLREKLHRTLSHQYGPWWFRGKTVTLDDRTRQQFREASARLSGTLTPERVIAEVSFGAWGDLLEVGGTSDGSYDSLAGRADYEADLWDGRLDAVFKGIASTRQSAASLVRRVRRLRNRVAHHESIVYGVHQPGEKDSRGHTKRQEPLAALADLRSLMLHFCPGATTWLQTCDHAAELLQDSLAVDALAHTRQSRKKTAWF
ncbi:hypothetical protein GCM10009860_25740 [Microbacterium mitrae]|uniref:Abi family protein n=1 Tax=Microbacterium mitrae TaxID=664640 RepID=UPI00164F6FE3|nr:Abi family protein [Microbacterium mitrae]